MEENFCLRLRFNFSLGLLVLLCCSFRCGLSEARSLAEIKKSGVLRVAVDGNTPGFNFYKNGVLTGLEVDLADMIAARMGLKVEWTVQPFNTLLIALRQDRFDLIADSHTITPQRAQLVDFLQPHYCSGSNIITKTGGPRTANDLKNKTVSVAVGTVYYDKLTTIPGIKHIMTVPSEADGFMALHNNRSDAWVTQKSMALSAINRSSQKDNFVIGDVILEQTNAMVIAKDNATLKAALNHEIQAIMTDGSYAKLMRQYVHEDICCK